MSLHCASSAPMPAGSASDEFGDRDERLTAIVAQLRSSAGDQALPTASTDDICRFQAIVLECAAELDLLNIALRADHRRRRTSEANLRASNAAMLNAVRKLVESLPGTMGAKRRTLRGKKRLMLYKVFGKHSDASKRGV